MTQITTYGDISPRVAAFAMKNMLTRAQPYLQLERFGQVYALPENSTQTAKFRRYYLVGATGAGGPNGGGVNGAGAAFSIPLATMPLVEGVTPSGTAVANADYTVTLQQYGDYVEFSDVIMDTHTDPILQQFTDMLGEQAAQTIEAVRFNVLKAGTNVRYQNVVSSRANVAGAISLADQRRVTSDLNRQNAKKISTVLASTPDFNTKSVEAAYYAVCHPDLESDIRSMVGFVPVASYGPHTTTFEGEIGAVEQVRYLTSTVIAPWANSATGGASATTFRSTGGTYPDVYPILYFARDSFGIVPLKGHTSLTPMVYNPKVGPGDPLAQRGTVGWKTYNGTVILQDAWMERLEVLATA